MLHFYGECTKGNSNKFYELVYNDGQAVLAFYGRIGSNPKLHVYTFTRDTDAVSFFHEQVIKKLSSSGYVRKKKGVNEAYVIEKAVKENEVGVKLEMSSAEINRFTQIMMELSDEESGKIDMSKKASVDTGVSGRFSMLELD